MLDALREIGRVDCVVAGVGVNSDQDDKTPVRRTICLQQVGPRPVLNRLRCGVDARFVGYNGHRAEKDDQAFVTRNIGRYDLVWIHNLETANAFDWWRWPRSVMDLDDVPSTFLRTVQQDAKTARERLRAGFRSMVARRREKLLLERFDIIAVCSEGDKAHLSADDRIHVIPNGFDRPKAPPLRCPADPPRLGFIGTFGYPPNAEGVRWFVEQCWPRVRRQVPDARLRLVGQSSATFGWTPDQGIDALGFVDDAAPEIATWSAMIVPLHIGAGTRVKIAEGFSRKCPIVSTSLGAFGYELQDGEAYLADTQETFASACVKAIREPQAAAAMADRAWTAFNEKWAWDVIRPRIWATAEHCLRRNHHSSGASNGSVNVSLAATE
jgi:glycosyltransferase involved in cell wall biosynthesis